MYFLEIFFLFGVNILVEFSSYRAGVILVVLDGDFAPQTVLDKNSPIPVKFRPTYRFKHIQRP